MRFVEDAEQAVLAAAKTMLRKGLVEGTAGNISAPLDRTAVALSQSTSDLLATVQRDIGHDIGM